MKSKSLLLSGFLAALFFSLLSPPASAVTRIWVGMGADPLWTTLANWSGNMPPSSGIDDLLFLSGQLSSVNNFVPVAHSIKFGIGGFALVGNSVQLTNGISATNATGQNVIALTLSLGANQSVTNLNAGTSLLLTVLDLNGKGVTFAGAGTNQVGSIVDGVGGGGLTNIGSRVFFLTGSNTFTGPTALNNGTNLFTGFHQRSPITWTAGKLGGTGQLGRVTASGAGAKLLAPGLNGPGILTTSNLVLTSSVTLAIRLNGTNAGVGYDQLVVSNGNVTLGSATLSLSASGISNELVGTTFTIISVLGAGNTVSGTFAGMAEAAETTNGGLRLRLSYAGGTGNDVTLTVIGVVPTGVQRTEFTGANQGDALLFTAFVNNTTLRTNPYPAGTSFDRLLLRDDPSVAGGVGTISIRGNLLRLEQGINAFNVQADDVAKFFIELPLALNRSQTFSNGLPWELRFGDIDLNGYTLTFDGFNDGIGSRGFVVTGLVSGATSPSAIIKQTLHPLTLQPVGGVATYAGSTTINAGLLTAIGTFASTMIVNPGATLSAGGVVGGIQSTGGIVAPINNLQSTGAVVLDAASKLHIGLPASPTTNSDRLIASAGVILGGAALVFTNGATALLQDTNYVIISKTSPGAVTGTFAGLPEGTEFPFSGLFCRISYVGGDGNDVVLIVTNKPPVFTPVVNQIITEQLPFTLDLDATDPEQGSALTFSLDAGSPANATIALATGVFSWTPTDAEGPGVYNFIARATDAGNPPKSITTAFQITVLETNFPPVLTAPITVTSNELTVIAFTVTATDPDSPPVNLTYDLLQMPAGMTISSASSASALITWTPTESQGPSTNIVLVRVSEPVGGKSSTQAVTVVAREVNLPPVLQPIAGTNVLQSQFIERVLVASDPDVPANTLTLQLLSPPAGAVIVSNAFFQWTPASNQVGNFTITVRCSDSSPSAVNATSLNVTQQFTVNVGLLRVVRNTNDSGTNSLRQAILDVNTNGGGGEIWFNIPGAGPQKIAPLTPLPDLATPMVIDGYTQPGAHANTLAAGTDASLLIELSGENIPNSTGLNWGGFHGGQPVNIRGLCVNRFTNGTAMNSGCASCGGFTTAGSVVEGCFIGTDPGGTLALPNGTAISYIQTHDSRIGGPDLAQRNLISGNRLDAIVPALGFDGNNLNNLTIQNNLIGCDRTGTNALGNGGLGIAAPSGCCGNPAFTATGCIIADNVFVANALGGVTFGGVSNVFVRNKIGVGADGLTPLGNGGTGLDLLGSGHQVGGTDAANANLIANNLGPGVHIDGGTGHSVLGNAIFRNTGLAIDLGSIGPDANDPGDDDTGANNLQNKPVLGSATPLSGGLMVSGTLNSASNTTFRLEFFQTDNFQPNNQPQSGRLVGVTNVTTDASSNATFAVAFTTTAPAGFITATATDPGGNTSETSAGVAFAGSGAGAPLLRISRTTTNTVAVFWPSPSNGFTLQQNTNSVSSVNWSNVTTTPLDDSVTKTVIVNPPTGNRFYRLFTP